MIKLGVVLTVALVLASSGTPLDKPVRPTPPQTTAVENMDPANRSHITCTTREETDLRMTYRNGVIDPKFRWTNFNVHPDASFTMEESRAINDAMYRLSMVIPCVNFGIWPPDSNPSGDYVRILKGNNGCNSQVGRLGGRQDLNLENPGCVSVGAVMHELIHALGFYHEHSRYDRDEHITILAENILPGLEYAFQKYPSSETSTFNVPYNTRSIMHYYSFAFSSNRNPTILTKDGKLIDYSEELQDTDIEKLKRMYNC